MATKEDKSALKRALGKHEDYKAVFSSPTGLRVLYDMFSNHHMMSSTFDANSINPQLQAFREGERNVILRILAILKSDPARVQKLIREADLHAEHLQDL